MAVDRRVVKQTAESEEPVSLLDFLQDKASGDKPGGPCVSAAGYSALVVEADPKSPGVMAGVAEILSRHVWWSDRLWRRIRIFLDAKMTLVVEGQLTGQAMEELHTVSRSFGAEPK